MTRTALIDGDLGYDPNKNYVTICGKVFSKSREELVPNRHKEPFRRAFKEKELKPHISKVGYVYIGITVNGKRYTRLLHRLVARTFIPNPLNLPEVNHKDGDKTNNRVHNLEWVSSSENQLHSNRVLKNQIGSKANGAKLKEGDVLTIKELLDSGVSQTEVAKMFNVTNHAIFRIHRGYNWSWLTGYGRKEVNDV
jgi:HNH endonuclease